MFTERQIVSSNMATLLEYLKVLQKKLPFPIVLPGFRLEFYSCRIQLKFVLRHGKKIKILIIQYLAKNLIQLIKLQIFFQKGKNIFQKEEERDLSQQSLKKLETKKSLIELEKLN